MIQDIILCWTFGVDLLPPTNEVWGKVIFSQASVCLSTGGVSVRGAGSLSREGGSLSRGISFRGLSVQGVSVMETPLLRWKSGW